LKKILATIVFSFISLFVYGQAPIPLDRAIKEAAENMEARVAAKSKIALINFTSPSVQFSDYALEELTANLVHSGHLLVVDRKEINLIRGELNFQYSGEVDEGSMQALGHMLGAQYIVSGSLADIGGTYRIVFRVLNVQTAVVEVQYRTNIANDRVVTALLGGVAKTAKLPKGPPAAAGKIGTGALNIVFGLGSYIEGDITGGMTLSSGFAVSAGLIIIEFAALNWDSPMVGVPITAGFCIAGLTLAYGFVRPFIHSRSPQTAYILDNTQIGIAMAQDRFGNNAFACQVSYSIKF
jgi:TolB-like protein